MRVIIHLDSYVAKVLHLAVVIFLIFAINIMGLVCLSCLNVCFVSCFYHVVCHCRSLYGS